MTDVQNDKTTNANAEDKDVSQVVETYTSDRVW